MKYAKGLVSLDQIKLWHKTETYKWSKQRSKSNEICYKVVEKGGHL